jgi:hypothetical protein
VVVAAKYTTFAKYGQAKTVETILKSAYTIMLPIVSLSVSNIDIAKFKRPIHELIVAAY